MALFGKKKSAESAPDSPAPQPTNLAPDEGAFDFDSIARDLDAQNGGVSPFDDLLAQPVAPQTPNNPVGETENSNGSAFDFPEDASDPLGFNSAPRPIPSTVEQVAPETDPFGLLADGTPVLGISPNQPKPVASTSLPTGLAGDEPFEPYEPVRKKSPLIPILAGLVVLALVGAGTFSFFRSQNAGDEGALDVETPITNLKTDAAPTQTIDEAPAPPVSENPRPGPPKAPPKLIKPKAPAPPPRSANPGIGTNPGAKVNAPKIAMATNPPLTPELKAQLREMWKLGAEAKKRGDSAAAAKAWRQALRLRPGHPGFQESIDKLKLPQ